jgi:L-amino acid N-acyltransferase YncA
MDLVIDRMRPEDWDDVVRIYLEGIATGQATFETVAPSREGWESAHLPGGGLVARAGGAVAGWAALSPTSARRVYSGVAEVTVYVAAALRGKGIGRELLGRLVALSEELGIWTLQAAVFPENEASLRLHTSLGFREVGRRKRIGKMNGVWRDVLLLERRSESVGV